MLIKNKATINSQSVKPMLLPYPRLKARQLSCEFSRVKQDSSEARLRPVEQIDREAEIVTR
jgi:hypothetical protein